jgi:hypothetical protein
MNGWKLRVVGITLITIGASIPLLALIVTFPVYGLFYPSDQYAFFTLPFIILALWMLPLVGGIYALRRRKWGLSLAGSITALCYIVPFTIISVNLIRTYDSLMLPMTILFCLLLLITLAGIPATIFVVMSKSEFKY